LAAFLLTRFCAIAPMSFVSKLYLASLLMTIQSFTRYQNVAPWDTSNWRKACHHVTAFPAIPSGTAEVCSYKWPLFACCAVPSALSQASLWKAQTDDTA
jgi:hypothetical protein